MTHFANPRKYMLKLWSSPSWSNKRGEGLGLKSRPPYRVAYRSFLVIKRYMHHSEIEQRSLHFAFPKGSKFIEMFNGVIQEERTEIRRLYRRYRELPYEMKRQNCPKEREKLLKTRLRELHSVTIVSRSFELWM